MPVRFMHQLHQLVVTVSDIRFSSFRYGHIRTLVGVLDTKKKEAEAIQAKIDGNAMYLLVAFEAPRFVIFVSISQLGI